MKIPIIMIHGISSGPITFFPLKTYLKNCGYQKLHCISYPVDTLSFNDSLDHVNKEIEKIIPSKKQEIILIGQSFGGNISNNLHKFGWNIQNAIYICSPLNGARIINNVGYYIPGIVSNLINKKAFDYLKDKEKEDKPPHKFHTISFGWFGGTFDGCVYEDEAKLSEENHTHISWTDHRTGFIDHRLFDIVNNILELDDENIIIEYIDE